MAFESSIILADRRLTRAGGQQFRASNLTESSLAPDILKSVFRETGGASFAAPLQLAKSA